MDKGTWNGSKGTLQVAVKSLNKNASQNDKVRLLQEAAIMGQFKHPNITHLHGIVTQGEPVSPNKLTIILTYVTVYTDTEGYNYDTQYIHYLFRQFFYTRVYHDIYNPASITNGVYAQRRSEKIPWETEASVSP